MTALVYICINLLASRLHTTLEGDILGVCAVAGSCGRATLTRVKTWLCVCTTVHIIEPYSITGIANPVHIIKYFFIKVKF